MMRIVIVTHGWGIAFSLVELRISCVDSRPIHPSMFFLLFPQYTLWLAYWFISIYYLLLLVFWFLTISIDKLVRRAKEGKFDYLREDFLFDANDIW